MSDMATRIQLRRDTAANWTSANPTLAQGEIGYETDTGKAKIGDGSTPWTTLGYKLYPAVDQTVIDAKGDLLVGTADNTVARLGVGTNGQVLTADSTQTGGVKWSDGLPSQTGNSGKYLTTNGTAASWGAVAAPSGFTLLNSGGTALTGAATITISGLSTYNQFYIWINAASCTGASSPIGIRINGSTANYNRVYIGFSGGNADGGQNQGAGYYTVGVTGAAAANELDSYISIMGANKAGMMPIQSVSFGNGTSIVGQVTSGYWNAATGVISSISIYSAGTNFDAGWVYIYGQ